MQSPHSLLQTQHTIAVTVAVLVSCGKYVTVCQQQAGSTKTLAANPLCYASMLPHTVCFHLMSSATGFINQQAPNIMIAGCLQA